MVVIIAQASFDFFFPLLWAVVLSKCFKGVEGDYVWCWLYVSIYVYMNGAVHCLRAGN